MFTRLIRIELQLILNWFLPFFVSDETILLKWAIHSEPCKLISKFHSRIKLVIKSASITSEIVWIFFSFQIGSFFHVLRFVNCRTAEVLRGLLAISNLPSAVLLYSGFLKLRSVSWINRHIYLFRSRVWDWRAHSKFSSVQPTPNKCTFTQFWCKVEKYTPEG